MLFTRNHAKTAHILDLLQEKTLYLRFSGEVGIAIHQTLVKNILEVNRAPARFIVLKLALYVFSLVILHSQGYLRKTKLCFVMAC